MLIPIVFTYTTDMIKYKRTWKCSTNRILILIITLFGVNYSYFFSTNFGRKFEILAFQIWISRIFFVSIRNKVFLKNIFTHAQRFTVFTIRNCHGQYVWNILSNLVWLFRSHRDCRSHYKLLNPYNGSSSPSTLLLLLFRNSYVQLMCLSRRYLFTTASDKYLLLFLFFFFFLIFVRGLTRKAIGNSKSQRE